TYGREFISGRYPKDGRVFINYNGGPHFNLRNLRAYWERSSGGGNATYGSAIRGWNTDYLGKRLEKLEVRYPSDDGIYRNGDDSGERYERLDGTFIVKPVKPSIQTSLGKVGQNRVTVNNVNSGTTVVVYDAANPNNLIELGRTTVTKEGNYRIKNGVEVPLNSGVTFKKDQKIVTKVIYAITDRDQRTESDVSDTWTVKESLIANGIHVIKGESYTGTAKDRIRYNDNVDADHRTALPNNATASWAQNPNYTTLGTNNYTANVTVPGQGSTTVNVPVHVYAPASLKANSYNNKQGTLSNGDNPENYIEFKDGNTVVPKPNNVTVRWQGGVAPRINTPGHNRGVIEVVYPGNAGASSTVVKTFTVRLPTYHTTATATEYTRTIGDNFSKTNARDYATTHNWNVGGSQYVWKNDETANREYSAENWGKVNGDWLGKKKNKVKVYYGNDNGSNSHSENLAEETEEITFITKPKTPNVTATALNGKAGQRNQQVTVNNVTPGTRLYLYDGDTLVGQMDVPKESSETYASSKDVTMTLSNELPYSSNIRAKVVYMPDNNDQRVESDFSANAQSTTRAPQAPTIKQNPEDLTLKSIVGQEGSNKATLTYTDASGRQKTVGFTKTGNNWNKDDANADRTIYIVNADGGQGEIRIQAGTAKEGTTVAVNQKTATSAVSDNGQTKVLGRLEGLTNVAQADGSVAITVPDTATKFDLTYRNQRNNTTETLHYSKDTQGRWGNVTGITANGNRFTLPKGLVADGTTVSVIASNDNKTTKTVTSDAKFEMPDATTHNQRENGDGVITLPSTADSVTLTYTDAQDTAKAVTVTKNASNQWASTADLPEGVTLNGNELSLAYKNINSGKNVKTVSTRGAGNVRSQEAVENIELNHRPVSTQAVVIAAGATPTNDDLGRGVAIAKRSITAKSTPAAVPAGTSVDIPATLTYNDGSTEDVTITVKSKPTAPTFNNLEDHGEHSGLSSVSKVISGTAMPGAEKVKLTLQDGTTVKEITPNADGSWSYTLGATEYLTQNFSGVHNRVFNGNKVKAVQVKNGVESEEATANVAPGQATIDPVYKSGRAITVNIPHDIEGGYVRVNGTDYGIQKVDGTWTVVSTASNAAKLEISNTVVDPMNKAITKVTFSVKNNDDALYTPPFKIGNSPVQFRTHYSKDGRIGIPTPGIQGTSGWADSPIPTNTKPTVNFTANHTIEDNKVFASPTVEELKDYFEGHDVEDDANLTVGYAASSRGKLRVQVFTQDTNQSVRANAQGRIEPGNYRLVLSTVDAADAESDPITRNITVKTYADVYRDKVLYPTNVDKVTYDDTAISNGNFTTAAKTSFKEKIQEANRQNTQLPTSATYSVGTTDDKTKVAVINFPDGSTIDISHAQVAKPTVPTFNATVGSGENAKLSDVDRTISGTALQSATKVVLTLQTGRTVEIDANNGKDPANLQPGEGALKNGVWTYKLPNDTYLRQTAQTAEIGSSDQPVKVKQTVFTAESDESKIYVAKERNFEGKTITAAKGSKTLTDLKADARKGIKYTEKDVEKDFPGDFTAKWKETPDIEKVGTRKYKVQLTETSSSRVNERDVTITVTNPAPAELTHENKQNGTTRIKLPDDADKVVFTIPGDNQLNNVTVTHSERDGWTVPANSVLTKDGDYLVVKSKDVGGTRNITAVATKGDGNLKSEATATSITVPEHTVETTKISKVVGGSTPTNEELLDAVTVDHKASAALKDGMTYPTALGTHTIEVVVTYADNSTEIINVPYEVRSADKTKLTEAKEGLSQELNKDAATAGKTDASKQAYEEAKQQAQEALNKADEVINNANASETEVNEAKQKLEDAKQKLEEAKAGLTDVNKQPLIPAKEGLSQELNKDAATAGKTDASKQAYEEAKQQAQEALNKADEVINNANASETEVNEAKQKLDEAKQKLADAKAGLQDKPTNGNTNNGGTTTPADSNSNSVTPDNSDNIPAPSVTTDDSRNTTPAIPSSTVGQAQASTPAQETPVSPSTPNNSGTTVTPSETRPVDKSELARLVDELEARLKALDGVDSTVVESAKALLADIKQALNDESLTEEELR
ncbi:Rib/alpha-like domain-containing protein, partial [Streptococcus pneumoniae]